MISDHNGSFIKTGYILNIYLISPVQNRIQAPYFLHLVYPVSLGKRQHKDGQDVFRTLYNMFGYPKNEVEAPGVNMISRIKFF